MSFDYVHHCKVCPSSTIHCCTKKGNIVLINDSEKNRIADLFESKLGDLNLPENFTLFNDAQSSKGVTPLNLVSEHDDKTGDEIDRCPFFKKPLCLIHDQKPLDCKLWPISKFENGDRMTAHIDMKCTAINAKERIPIKVVEESIKLFDSLTQEQKETYFLQSKAHYELGAVPLKIWEKFQEFKEKYNDKPGRAEKQITVELERLENTFVTIKSNSKEVLYITKWVVGIFFAAIIGALINQSVGNVESFRANEFEYINGFFAEPFLRKIFQIVAICAITIVFIGDTYRIIIPLPWIIKDYSEDPFGFGKFQEKFKGCDLPSYQVTKFGVIGTLSFFLLNIMAIRFVYEPIYYLLLYGIIMGLDLSWYYVNKKRLDVIVFLLKITLPVLLVVTFFIINRLSLLFPFTLCLVVVVVYFFFNFFDIGSRFPIEEQEVQPAEEKQSEFNNRERVSKARQWYFLLTQVLIRFANKLFFFFQFPSVETEKKRIANKIKQKCGDELFKKEKEEMMKYAENIGQSVDCVIALFSREKDLLKKLKESKLLQLGEKIDLSQECERHIDKKETRLAAELYFKLIAWIDFAICIVPAALVILNEHFLHSELVYEKRHLILSAAFFAHAAVMLVELSRNKFYKEYLTNLFIKKL